MKMMKANLVDNIEKKEYGTECESELTNFQKVVNKFLVVYALVCLISVILFNTVWMLSIIPSGSMEGTIKTGDVLISTRYDVKKEDIKRYDILIFHPPGEPEDTTYIKRVIGLPGETIEVRNGKVFADGVELDNSFIKRPQNNKGDGTYVVPEGHYFFLGDNRNNSNDSRFWEESSYVSLEEIQAKAKFTLFPFSRFGNSLEYKGEKIS